MCMIKKTRQKALCFYLFLKLGTSGGFEPHFLQHCAGVLTIIRLTHFNLLYLLTT